VIRRHDFNSEWWGGEVGIVADDTLFRLPPDERDRELAAWDWVEARGALDPARCVRAARAGFVHVDTQVRFRIGLGRIASTPSVERLEVVSTDNEPFEIPAGALADFEHERFSALPGVTMERLNERYRAWSAALLAADPAHALEIRADGEVQGWFLGRRGERGLELTLAMLHREARITGHHLYTRALLAYAERGARVGSAAFSVTNSAVLNIYAALGARFLEPEGCWLWTPVEGDAR